MVLGCGGDDHAKDGSAATVTVAGEWTVTVGKTVTLAATTADAQDSSYIWTSSADTVATVHSTLSRRPAPGHTTLPTWPSCFSTPSTTSVGTWPA